MGPLLVAGGGKRDSGQGVEEEPAEEEGDGIPSSVRTAAGILGLGIPPPPEDHTMSARGRQLVAHGQDRDSRWPGNV